MMCAAPVPMSTGVIASGRVRRRAAPIQSPRVGFGMLRAGTFAGFPRDFCFEREEDATDNESIRPGSAPYMRWPRRVIQLFSSITSNPTTKMIVPKQSTCGGSPTFAAPYTNSGNVTAGPATKLVIT